MRTMKLYQRRWLLLRRLALVIMMGSLAACDVHILAFFFGSLLPPGGERPDCRTSSVTVAPGTCEMISNPCGGSWPNAGGFRLRDEPTGIWVKTIRTSPFGIIRTEQEICARAEDVAIVQNQPVNYLYTDLTQGVRLFGTGIIRITTGNSFSVAASATPPTINSGERSQLLATPSGGIPPYTFVWFPVSTLSQIDIANPVASPTITTIYNVTAGVVRYEWVFSFEPGNPDLVRTTPLAQWEYGFGSTGTITLRVFDAGGASASTALPFP